MAKPDETWTGSSSHVHMSLWDAAGERNLFRGVGSPGEMSQTMRHFLGGLTGRVARALALHRQQRQLVQAIRRRSWAPVNIVWARDNRTCGFRIVGHGSSLRIENRLPGGDANPYLTYAAMLAAGLDGIERGIEPRRNFAATPMRPPMCRACRGRCPRPSPPAGQRPRAGAFGDDVVAHYLNMAEVEHRAFDMAVTDWERRRYFERG